MISFTTVNETHLDALALAQFREMDYYAVDNYSLPIELMMENAGLQLAILISKFTKSSDIIQIGIGNGNNGGGGLVAARRLAAWGYNVVLDVPVDITKELPKLQLARAFKFGVKDQPINAPTVWVDAYLGFSQRLPLSVAYQARIEQANQCNCLKVSLDIPTGYLGDPENAYFTTDQLLCLAAYKQILTNLPTTTMVYLADLGIPKAIYDKFEVRFPPFDKNTILKIEK